MTACSGNGRLWKLFSLCVVQHGGKWTYCQCRSERLANVLITVISAGPGAEGEDVAGLEPAEAEDHHEADARVAPCRPRMMLLLIHLTLSRLCLRQLQEQLPNQPPRTQQSSFSPSCISTRQHSRRCLVNGRQVLPLMKPRWTCSPAVMLDHMGAMCQAAHQPLNLAPCSA